MHVIARAYTRVNVARYMEKSVISVISVIRLNKINRLRMTLCPQKRHRSVIEASYPREPTHPGQPLQVDGSHYGEATAGETPAPHLDAQNRPVEASYPAG